MDNRPLSEQFRLNGLEWARLDEAASLMEETKSVRLSQHIQNLIAQDGNAKMPHNQPERMVKATQEWAEEIAAMVYLRGKANRAKIELEALRLQHAENQSFEANRRAEMKLY